MFYDSNKIKKINILYSKKKEVWKDVQGFEGHYKISSFGRVKSIKFNKEKILKPKIQRQGYHEYELSKPGQKSITVRGYRLVAMHFIPNPCNYPVVNHIDGNKSNNHVSNLEWCDYSHNNKHAYDNNLNNNKKAIIQMDMNGNFIKRYGSIREACIDNDIPIKNASNIIKVCKGKGNSCHGYKWRYSQRGFEVVADEFRKHPNIDIMLPRRGTSKAMAYDFFSPIEYELYPGEKILIFTDIKAYMQEGEALLLNPRSSMGKLDLVFANTQGWIDCDYYGNKSNDGNIGIYLKNNGREVVGIKVGDRIGQGCFIPFLIADNGNTDVVREGGYGSTGK